MKIKDEIRIKIINQMDQSGGGSQAKQLLAEDQYQFMISQKKAFARFFGGRRKLKGIRG